MRVLIVKTSSMGDVVHALPAVTDLLRHHPGAQVDWLVEAPFAAIPQLHPGVRRVLPMAWRKWRRALFKRATWSAIAALRAIEKGGTVVCAGIHMSDIPSFPYSILWGERRIVSVANLTRRDGDEFLALAPRVGVRTEVTRFALEDANDALDRLRRGALQGAAVLVP